LLAQALAVDVIIKVLTQISMQQSIKLRFILLTLIILPFIVLGQQTTKFPKGLQKEYQPGMDFPDFTSLTTEHIVLKSTLPTSVDNSTLPYLRPVFSQQGASCGQAAIVGYNFTYEINRLRDVASDTSIHLYPDHFVWNFMNAASPYYGVGVSYFHTFDLLYDAGNPNEALYGPIELDDSYYWPSGYEVYHNAMTNRIGGAASIRAGTPEGLEVLKHWLHNHLEGDETGGVANFYAGLAYWLQIIPDDSPEAGKPAFIRFGPEATHAMTIVGYNDSIRFDINQDGQYTNHLDITGDGIVDMRDWEFGALKAVNSYGTIWGDYGFFYLMYRTLALEYGEQGGIWNNSVHVLFPEPQWQPKLTIKASLKHNSREKIKLRAGVSLDTSRHVPDHSISFTHFNFQGGDYPLRGRGIDANEPLELGLDISELLSYVPAGQPARFFLLIDEKDPDYTGSGILQNMSLREYEQENLIWEQEADFVPKTIQNNGTTYVSVVLTPETTPPSFLPDERIIINAFDDTLINLQAVSGEAPFSWQILPEYIETAQIKPYPEVQTTILLVADEDQGYATVPLPFSFPFAEQSYDTLYMHVDGYLMFEPEDMPYYYLLYDELYLRQLKIMAGFMHQELGLLSASDRLGYSASADSIILKWQISGGSPASSLEFSATLFPDGKIKFHYKNLPSDMEFTPVIGLGFAVLENSHRSKPLFSKYSGQIPPENLLLTFTPGADLQRLAVNHNQQLSWLGGNADFGQARLRMTDAERGFSEQVLFVSSGPDFKLSIADGESYVATSLPTTLDLYLQNLGNQTIEINSLQLIGASTGFQLQNSLPEEIIMESESDLWIRNAAVIQPEDASIQNVAINIVAEIDGREILAQASFETAFTSPVLYPPLVIDNNNLLLEAGEQAKLVYELHNLGTKAIENIELVLHLDDPFVMLISDSIQLVETLGAQQLIRMEYLIQTTAAAPHGRLFEVFAELLSGQQLVLSSRDWLQIGISEIALFDMDRNHNSASILERELTNNAIDYSRYEAIDSAIYNYEIAFLTLGVMPNYYTITSAEDQLLSDYLRGGGNLYLEGGSFFFTSPPTQLRELLRIEGFMDGVQYPADTLVGLSGSPVEEMLFTYQGDQALCENLLPLEPAQPWFVDPQTNLNFVAAIDSIRYKGIATSMEFGGLTAQSGSSLTQLMRTYLEFLGYAQAPISARFSSDKRTICMNQNVQFSFDGIGDPETFLWTFEGGQANSITSRTPVVNYSTPGNWPVSLKVNQGNYSDSVHVQEYIVVNNCSSISESVISELSVYPNPASESVKIALPEALSENSMLSLFDLNGKLIRETPWPKARQITGMKIANLKPGVYVLRLKSLQKLYLGKLIVN
jgi:hypothetical protein